MRERKHKNKKYLAIFYDRCESLIKSFKDDEIGEIVRGAIIYELYGDAPDIKDRALQIMCETLCSDIDIMTEKADKWSEKQREKAKNRWGKDKSAGMTAEEIDAEINAMFPAGIGKN